MHMRERSDTMKQNLCTYDTRKRQHGKKWKTKMQWTEIYVDEYMQLRVMRVCSDHVGAKEMLREMYV